MASTLFGPPETLTPGPVYSLSQYGIICLGSCASLAALRVVLEVAFFQPIARLALLDRKEQQMTRLPAKRASAISKFTESMWKLTYYIAMWCFGAWALHDKAWLWDTLQYWVGMPYQPQSVRVTNYYGVQTGFYLSSIFMLQFWDTRRKDFSVLMAHHFTTLTLLVSSHFMGAQRIGSVILLLHDSSDILLEAAKLLNYAKLEGPSIACFLSMAASWLYLRLLLFPRHIIYSTMYEFQQVHGRPLDYYWVMNGMLWTLLAMHVYWFMLIGKVAVKTLQGEAKDVREDDD